MNLLVACFHFRHQRTSFTAMIVGSVGECGARSSMANQVPYLAKEKRKQNHYPTNMSFDSYIVI